MVDSERVKQVMAAALEVEPSQIREDSSMDSIASWDSLHQMTLVLALEEAFGVSFPDEDAANATSYELIVMVLAEQLAAA